MLLLVFFLTVVFFNWCFAFFFCSGQKLHVFLKENVARKSAKSFVFIYFLEL